MSEKKIVKKVTAKKESAATAEKPKRTNLVVASLPDKIWKDYQAAKEGRVIKRGDLQNCLIAAVESMLVDKAEEMKIAKAEQAKRDEKVKVLKANGFSDEEIKAAMRAANRKKKVDDAISA